MPDYKNETIRTRIKKLFKKSALQSDEILCNTPAYDNLDSHRQEMIRGVFSLSVTNAKDIMIPRVDIFALEQNIGLQQLLQKVIKTGHSRVPVYDENIDNITGILHVKDLLKIGTGRSGRKFNLRKILHESYFIPQTMPLNELMYEFKKRKLHLAVVVDEYGGVSGIVTLEDILEEIVGEIKDEFDNDTLSEIEKKGKNQYEVDSRVSISDFNTTIGSTLPEDKFDTIGGFVYDLFGRVPEKNETTGYGRLNFRIKSITGTVINRIIVTINRAK